MESLVSSERYTRETLARYSVQHLETISRELANNAATLSQFLVHLLVDRDTKRRRMESWSEQLTDMLMVYAKESGLNPNLKFDLLFNNYHISDDYEKWLNSWIAVSRIKKGIPRQWQKMVWSGVATHCVARYNWDKKLPVLFHSKLDGRDLEWKAEIEKRLAHSQCHYSSCQKGIERVIIGYSRYNKKALFHPQYCALVDFIMKVTKGEEESTLKILICLLKHTLPPTYYNDIVVDVGVVRDLLAHLQPQLNKHLKHIKSVNNGSGFMCSSPLPSHDKSSLIDSYNAHWFSHLFTASLPLKALHRVFDALFLEGHSILLYTCLAVWTVMETELIDVKNVDDFYSKMDELSDKLKHTQLMPSHKFIQVVYTLEECIKQEKSLNIKELRLRHYPPPPTNPILQLPSPADNSSDSASSSSSSLSRSFMSHREKRPSDPQVHILVGHNMPSSLTAKAECPQTKASGFMFANAYGADIPQGILEQYTRKLPYVYEPTQPYMNLLKKGCVFDIKLENSQDAIVTSHTH